MIASTLAVAGAGVTGAGLAAAWKMAGRVAHADGASQTLDAPAQALAPAVRIQPPNRLTFPVQLPGDLIVLNNFGAPRTFGPGRHDGIDIGRRDQLPGHPLVACLDGVLVEQQILAPNQGNSWVLQAADGMAYRYHHLADFEPGLKVGDVVTRGQVIGTMGRTGNPNVPHLHFEARRGGPIGTPIDPFPLLPLPLPGVAVI